MNYHEINPDKAIDRLFSGLREVEPPQGMERRILEAAQARDASQMRGPVAALLGLRPWAVAAVGVVVFSLAVSFALHGRNQGRIEMAETKTHIAPETLMPTTKIEEFPTSRPDRGGRSVPRPSKASHAKPETLGVEEALALSEMNAPSKPAPPLPLTGQEKMLAKAVHQSDPEELSSLRPEIRARQLELSKAEFRDFFEPPSAKHND